MYPFARFVYILEHFCIIYIYTNTFLRVKKEGKRIRQKKEVDFIPIRKFLCYDKDTQY